MKRANAETTEFIQQNNTTTEETTTTNQTKSHSWQKVLMEDMKALGVKATPRTMSKISHGLPKTCSEITSQNNKSDKHIQKAIVYNSPRHVGGFFLRPSAIYSNDI